MGTVGDFTVEDGGIPDLRVDTHITDGDPAAEVLGQHRRAGFGAGQVQGLLQGHRLGRAGHPFGHHPVVGRKNQQLLFVQGGVDPAGDPGHLDRQIFEAPQTARGFGEPGLVGPGGLHSGAVRVSDGGQQGFQFLFHPAGPLNIQFPAGR